MSVKPSDEKLVKLLGIGDRGPCSSSTVTVLIQGQAHLKLSNGSSNKRFCVVKDAFLIWYETAPLDSNKNKLSFEKKPKGIFPLNRASIKKYPSAENSLEIKNEDILKFSILLTLSSAIETSDWEDALKKGSERTWEKAQLGVAELERVKQEATRVEAEKAAADKQREQNEQELADANDKKQALLMKKAAQTKQFELKMDDTNRTIDVKRRQLKELQEQNKEEEKQMKDLNSKNKALEQKLEYAHATLKRLDKSLQEYFGHDLSHGLLSQSRNIRNREGGVKADAASALKTAMVNSSPELRNKAPVKTISSMNLSRTSNAVPPPMPPLPDAAQVSKSLQSIGDFINMNRKGSNFSGE